MITAHRPSGEDRMVTLKRVEGLCQAKLLDAFDRVINAYCQMKGLIDRPEAVVCAVRVSV
jgi:hypothetical protein